MSEDFTEMLNGTLDGYNQALGLRFVSANKDCVIAEIEVGPRHLQPYGLVHGGVYASMAETVCSVGAAVNAMADGHSAVGVENHTTFLQAVRGGTLRATATPLAKGRKTHVWQATITDAEGRTAAIAQVRLLVLEKGMSVAGETVGIKF